jgi:CcmD family protein
MEHFGYLFAAYSIVFVAIVLYVMFIWRRQAALEAELRALEARLGAAAEVSARADSADTAESPPQL